VISSASREIRRCRPARLAIGRQDKSIPQSSAHDRGPVKFYREAAYLNGRYEEKIYGGHWGESNAVLHGQKKWRFYLNGLYSEKYFFSLAFPFFIILSTCAWYLVSVIALFEWLALSFKSHRVTQIVCVWIKLFQRQSVSVLELS
jgi:pilus assembly protein TadC